MANIIINNYCNQKCEYCFAWKNMGDVSLKKEMNLKTFLYCLQHLKNISDTRVRILWWEPLLHSRIQQFIQVSLKWGFDMTIFSNLKIPQEKLYKILDFWEDFQYRRITFNLNLNDRDFYSDIELVTIYDSLRILEQKGTENIISYNVYEYSYKYDFIFDTAKRFWVQSVVLKVTNTVVGDKEIIDSNSRKYGNYIFGIIQKYAKDFHITFGCGLSRYIFSDEQREYIEKNTDIVLKYGCENNGGKYDINTDGSIFRCYPLQSLYHSKDLDISNKVIREKTYRELKDYIDSFIPHHKYKLKHDGNCLWNQINNSNV